MAAGIVCRKRLDRNDVQEKEDFNAELITPIGIPLINWMNRQAREALPKSSCDFWDGTTRRMKGCPLCKANNAWNEAEKRCILALATPER